MKFISFQENHITNESSDKNEDEKPVKSRSDDSQLGF